MPPSRRLTGLDPATEHPVPLPKVIVTDCPFGVPCVAAHPPKPLTRLTGTGLGKPNPGAKPITTWLPEPRAPLGLVVKSTVQDVTTWGAVEVPTKLTAETPPELLITTSDSLTAAAVSALVETVKSWRG